MSARKDLATELGKLMPRTWQIIDTDELPDHIRKTAVLISQRRIQPAPGNPLGSHLVSFRVYVVDPHTDSGKAEDALDSAVDSLLYAIDGLDPIRWTAAEKVIYEQHRAYEITIEAFSERTTE